MATWDTPIDSQTDPDAPVTSLLGKRWDNNVIAMGEGASGAQRIAVKSVSGSGGTVDFTSLVDFLGAQVNLLGNDSGGAGGTVSLALSDDGGATFYASSAIATIGSGQSVSCHGSFDFVSGAYRFVYGTGVANGENTGTLAGAGAGVDAYRLSTGVGTITLSAFCTLNGGDTTV